MAAADIKTALEQMIEILAAEKEALIQNDGKKIEALLAMKEDFLNDFERYAGTEPETMDEEILALLREIKERQETNLMLTKQALNYTDTFISAYQKAAKKEITYSDKTNKPGNGKSSILNQSL